jgi:hypothetical protein
LEKLNLVGSFTACFIRKCKDHAIKFSDLNFLQCSNCGTWWALDARLVSVKSANWILMCLWTLSWWILRCISWGLDTTWWQPS